MKPRVIILCLVMALIAGCWSGSSTNLTHPNGTWLNITLDWEPDPSQVIQAGVDQPDDYGPADTGIGFYRFMFVTQLDSFNQPPYVVETYADMERIGDESQGLISVELASGRWDIHVFGINPPVREVILLGVIHLNLSENSITELSMGDIEWYRAYWEFTGFYKDQNSEETVDVIVESTPHGAMRLILPKENESVVGRGRLRDPFQSHKPRFEVYGNMSDCINGWREFSINIDREKGFLFGPVIGHPYTHQRILINPSFPEGILIE